MNKKSSRTKNLSYAAIAGQAGCWITLMVFVALFAGLWLDAQLGLRGPFTVGMVVISVPITLFVVFRIVLGLLHRIEPLPKNKQPTDSPNEEVNR
jgi:hypothetical protein